LNRNNIQANNI